MARVRSIAETMARLGLVKALANARLTPQIFAQAREALLAASSEVDARQIAAAMSRFGDDLLPLARELVADKRSSERKKGIELFAAATNPDTIAELTAAKAADRSKALHRDYDYAIRRIEKAAGDRARPALDPRDRTHDPVARLDALGRMSAEAFQDLVGMKHRYWARDYALPTLEFDRGGRRPLSVGETEWQVIYERGALAFEMPGGKRTDTLPRSASPAAKDAVRALTKSLAALAAKRAARLTEMLVIGEPTVAWLCWLLHVDHPLRDPGVRQLVFEHRDERAWRSFAVAEDGETFVDVGGAAVAVPDDASVRLAHPAELAPDALAAWRARVADGRSRPPIDQLGRAVHRPADHGNLEALVGSLPPMYSLTLAGRFERLGFGRGEVDEHGLVADQGRVLADDVALWVRHSAMPVRRRELRKDAKTTLRRAWFTRSGKEVSASTVPPRAYAEAVTLLLALGAR